MKPEDKFGRPIYNHIYSQLLNIGMKLERSKYKESETKPNLFYKYNDFGKVCADMRGTEEVPIWEEPIPLVYFYFREGVPIWKQIRFKKEELKILDSNQIPYRFSFYVSMNSVELFYEVEDELADEERKIFGVSHLETWYHFYGSFPDGYCKGCGKDIKESLYHCSEECREMEYRKIEKKHRKMLARTVNESPHCEVCKKKIPEPWYRVMIKDEFGIDLPDKLIKHHISYDPEKTIVVCASCHSKIHHSKDERLKSFLPEDSKPKKTVSKRKKVAGTNEIKELFIKCKRCNTTFDKTTKITCPKCGVDPDQSRRCENCGNVFNDYGRTTCPKCRAFFR